MCSMFFDNRILYRISLVIFLFPVPHGLLADNTGTSSENPHSIIEHYNNANCCVYVNQIESVQLERGASLEIDLSESEDLLEASTGPTFAKLISIPASSKRERYSIRTDIIEYDNELYAFFPNVVGLDADFRLLWTTHFNQLNYVKKQLLAPKSHLHFRIILDANINKENGVKYFLLYTRAKHFTNSKISDLKGENRNVSLREVSVRLIETTGVGYSTRNDIIYGLPAGTVKLTHRQR